MKKIIPLTVFWTGVTMVWSYNVNQYYLKKLYNK